MVRKVIQYMRDEFNMHDQTSIFSSISSFSSFVAYTIVLTVNNHDHSWMKATFNHYSLLKRIQNLLEIMFWYRFGHSNNVIRLQNRFSAKMRGFNPTCLTSFILDDQKRMIHKILISIFLCLGMETPKNELFSGL